MFQLLPCSACQRTFSVRGEVSEAALLKCPNCGNQFRIGELLDALYAPWQVVEDPGTLGDLGVAEQLSFAPPPAVRTSQPMLGSSAALMNTTTFDQPRTEFSIGSHRDLEVIEEEHLAGEQPDGLSLEGDAGELRLAEDAIDEIAAATSDGIEVADQRGGVEPVDWSKFKPISQEEYKRLRRGTRSSIWSTLQVVLGGAAAIPVSLLLLWYVLGKDVAGAGPAVAQYLPWIVPHQFHGVPPELPGRRSPAEARRPSRSSARNSLADSPQNSTLETAQDSAPVSPQRGDSGFRKFDDVLPLDESHKNSTTREHEAGSPVAAGDRTASKPTLALDPREAASNTGELASDARVTDASIESSGEVSDLRDLIATPSLSKPGEAPAGSSENFSAAEVLALLKRTKEKVDAWPDVADAQAPIKAQAAIALFDDLATLGIQLSMQASGRGAPQLMHERAKDISRAIKAQARLVEVLHNTAKAQLNGKLPRSKQGWVLVCTIGQAREEGNAWRVTVSDPALVHLKVPAIEIPKSVLPQAMTGQRLILLGRFVPDEASGAAGEVAPKGELFRASFSYGL